ncbi:MAG: carboxypeptidase-like regulatory domain-containing protein, partial [Bacteroidales bacterium]|nr:carboxypeptidase-like regulatory domain-containing protein [Bacteroidales bacterium]
MSFKQILTVALLSWSSVIVMAQNKRISGTVVDTNGDPVIGAGVTHVGTTNGVVTDGRGNFVFSVPDGATINVEALGYESQEFTVTPGRNVYDVTLAESATELDE